MTRVRYETYCNGRLLKVYEQVDVSTMGDVADGDRKYVDGYHFWKVDEQEVASDVARAMLDKYGETASHKGLKV